jgi:DNA-binding CsgD family transcriptional regulator
MVILAASGADVTRADGGNEANDWPMYNYNAAGTRYNTAESKLKPANVGGLHVVWQYVTPAPVAATPVVVGGVVYAGDMAGKFYALREDGTLLWSTQLAGSITATALVTSKTVVFGDISGNLYGLDRKTGAIKWQTRPDPHPLAAIWGSPTRVGSYVVVGVASNEESAAADPSYPCCSTVRQLKVSAAKRTSHDLEAPRIPIGGVALIVLISPPVSEELPAGLSLAERDVLRSLLRGESNAQVAARRRTALRTTANQVASIFRKIGVASRAELAARLTR